MMLQSTLFLEKKAQQSPLIRKINGNKLVFRVIIHH